MTVARPTQTMKHSINASVFIALIILNTWAIAQNVYKCGNSYSQTPCPGGQTINVDDTRTHAQKEQTDTAVQRDAQQAQTLENLRLTQEKATLKQRSDVAPSTGSAVVHKPAVEANGVVHKITPKRLRPKHNKPDAFVAQIPGTEPKVGVKKTARKKTVQPAASSPA